MAESELIILTTLQAQRGPAGGWVLTRKYLAGLAEYAKLWPGRVSSLVRMDSQRSSDLDHIEVQAEQLAFGLEERPGDPEVFARRIQSAALVLAYLCDEEITTARLCRRLGVPLVFVSEYSLETAKDIINAEVVNPLIRWRRKWWVTQLDVRRRAALGLAAGLQCSGLPTYLTYRGLHPNAMLFFDNRVPLDQVLDDAGLSDKWRPVRRRQPLRLVFGGRWVKMKGVMDLPRFALELRRAGVSFTLDIYGGGVLEAPLRQAILRAGMDEHVRLRGVLDFESEWIPLLKERVDLFICPHLQGDPSSTYPEVMSCGVPIVGYDNEAFAGLVDLSGAGWLAKMGRPDLLAQAVARLDQDREAIAWASWLARDFARRHAFERTFRARVDHLVGSSRLPAPVREGHKGVGIEFDDNPGSPGWSAERSVAVAPPSLKRA